ARRPRNRHPVHQPGRHERPRGAQGRRRWRSPLLRLVGSELSRIGKLPIPVPSAVKVELQGNFLKVEGPKVTVERALAAPRGNGPPAGISIEVADPTHFAVTGINRELVGKVAADLRKLRPPEPYKGKGIMYRGERIRRKAGKAGKGAKA